MTVEGEAAGLLAAVEARVQNPASVPAYRRAQEVRLSLKGKAPEEIADLMGVSLSHVKTTLADWRRRGLVALEDRKRGGRRHTYMTWDEEAAFLDGLKEKAEKGGVVVVGVVHQALRDRLRVPVAQRTVYDLLARHGWRKVKPRPRHAKADPAAQQAFRETVFPTAVEAAATHAAAHERPLRVMFMDEGRFGLLPDPRSCWAPPGVRPIVPVEPVRQYSYAFAAVSPLDGAMDSLVLPTVNTELMGFFLDYVAQRHPQEYILMVMDGAGWHGSNDLIVPPNMRLVALPAYSPELNPTEHVWDDVREKRFANRYYTGLPAMEDDLVEELAALQRDPARVAGITGFAWITACLQSSNAMHPVSV